MCPIIFTFGLDGNWQNLSTAGTFFQSHQLLVSNWKLYQSLAQHTHCFARKKNIMSSGDFFFFLFSMLRVLFQGSVVPIFSHKWAQQLHDHIIDLSVMKQTSLKTQTLRDRQFALKAKKRKREVDFFSKLLALIFEFSRHLPL